MTETTDERFLLWMNGYNATPNIKRTGADYRTTQLLIDLRAERDALKHDMERQAATCTELATDNEKLRAQGRGCCWRRWKQSTRVKTHKGKRWISTAI
jgi:hypothetical protein